MKPLQNIAFVINTEKSGAVGLADDLIQTARSAGASVERTTSFPVPRGLLRGRDACCVIGGDGTLLGAAVEAARENVPIIGVNRGSLGFLTTFTPEEARDSFAAVLAGHHSVSNRTLLQCGEDPDDIALNDIVIKETGSSRLISLDVFADGERITRYGCDGLIFATPTGSTAYNLSAGGPITHPGARVIIMTPICPHTLSNRTVIFEDSVELAVTGADSEHPLSVVLDGQRTREISPGTPLAIKLSPRKVPLVQLADHKHFGILRTKLGWSGGSADRFQGES